MTNKYGARKTRLDGYTFDSQAEAERYAELRLAEQAGEITGLVLQPRFDLHVNGQQVGRYTADFAFSLPSGQRIVEDVKSPATAAAEAYRLRLRMVKAEYGIEIVEIMKLSRRR